MIAKIKKVLCFVLNKKKFLAPSVSQVSCFISIHNHGFSLPLNDLLVRNNFIVDVNSFFLTGLGSVLMAHAVFFALLNDCIVTSDIYYI